MKRTVKDLVGLKGKVVLLRVDFNVPIDENGKILDTTRIVNALPTIKYLSKEGARVVLLSHLDRPKGFELRKSLWPIALLLMKRLDCNVDFCNKTIGDEVKERISHLKDGNVLLLENTRFYEGETKCDMEFAKELASLGDIFVNDAFGVAHRENASNYGIARILPNAIGLLMEKEITELGQAMENPKKPFVAVLGGSKVETKVKILNKFVDQADVILIGGAMAYTFLYAMGLPIGESIYYPDSVSTAKEILARAKKLGKTLLLPVDHVCIRKTDKKEKVMTTSEMIDDMVGYDIGPKTIALYKKEIMKAGQIIWNGPMGMYEDARFKNGTYQIAKAISETKGYTIVGGGDSVAAVNSFNLGKKIDYISTGGGATLKFLEDGTLPCIEVIQEKIK